MLVLVFALIGVLATLTSAWSILLQVNVFFLLIAAVFFLLNVFIWIISWAYLIKKKEKISSLNLLIIGFSAVFGALTPIQVGAEALRSIKLKEYFGVSYSESISASLINKGAKFLILAIFSSFIFLYLIVSGFSSGINPLIFFAFSTGFFVVVLAAMLFLLPLNKEIGLSISKFFRKLNHFHSLFSKAGEFFENYSLYLSRKGTFSFIVVFVLAFFSWMAEFFALYFSFMSLNASLELYPMLLLLIIFSILERTPFLPRGIGLLELVGYNFLAFPIFSQTTSLTVSLIGGVLVVYNIVRIVIPTVLSILFNAFFTKKYFRN